MIDDLSKTLSTVLTTAGAHQLTTALISFDRPTAQFNPQQTAINLFLFDIRENVELRSNEPIVTRSDTQATIRRPPMRVDCSYLVTAWAVGGTEVALQEQLLLSQVLQVLARHPTIPPSYLQGSLKRASATLANRVVNSSNVDPSGEPSPVPLSVAVPAASRQPTEFWTSLGIPVRACLVVTATIALDLNDPIPNTFPLVISHAIELGTIAGDTVSKKTF
ncbi:DUF4255 domain-containing protein [Leptolyngbya sp. NK1-12]|uniref:DUF4255 domain-containing protein n=1 Tax=Leptolyngbya sp. NK1-12 TaxID=2547451 RepID=A0AA96WQV8_9CYAN|nr:DUF4255 domain-containing protein [Leptolyngbya sp. NK1-12]